MADVLFVIGTMQVGGTELHLYTIAAALRRRGWDVSLCSLSGDGPLRQQFEASGVKVLLPPVNRGGRMNPFVRFAKLTVAAIYLFGVFLRRRPRIVHFFLPRAYLMGAPLAALAHLPIRVMSRRSLNRYQASQPLLRQAEHLAHRTMSAVLGNSQSVVRELLSEGVPADRLGTIYNGIDAARFGAGTSKAALRRALALPDGAVVLTIVANLIPYKGHRDLLEALAVAAPALKTDWRLLVVGRDDGIGPALQQTAADLGIAKNIAFLGLRSDIADILCASDVGLSCSHEEGFSNAVLEAMACGLPMIVTDVGGNPEAVIDGETGFVVPPRDPPKLAQVIARLANDSVLRDRQGRAGRDRIVSHFLIDRCVDQYETLYRALMDGRRPADIPGLGFAPAQRPGRLQSVQKAGPAAR